MDLNALVSFIIIPIILIAFSLIFINNDVEDNKKRISNLEKGMLDLMGEHAKLLVKLRKLKGR